MKLMQNRGCFAMIPFAGVLLCLFADPEVSPGQFAPPGDRVVIEPARPSKSVPAADQSTPSDLPDWKAIEKSVRAEFAQIKDYKPGDLITREDAAGVFPALKKLGWKLKKPDELIERMLPASDDMVRQLRSKQGQKFMHDVSGVAGGFDRLDRLRNLPNGTRRLRELIQNPGGATLIEYMATTPGGKNMGRQLSTPNRGDFNAATKRIYTESELISALKSIYEAESAALSK
jgi:hypothetical protein